MKIRKKSNDVKRTGISQQSNFNIKTSGKAFEILSSGLYSDKVLAIVRELSTNASDAHIEAGTADKPFIIHLPNALEPFYSIRDFGTGMAHDRVMVHYVTYFDSTKDDSDDYNGCLGLGSKSPFSYTDSFTVVSYFNGEKRSYGLIVGEEGVPEINLMDTRKTTEPNGLEITIPVKDGDFYEFEKKAARILNRFDPIPTVTGSADFEVEPIEYVLEGTDWGLIGGRNRANAVAIQGNIAYPIKTHSITDDLTGEQRTLIQETPVEIQFELGDLDISANREELGYDKRTIANILAKVDVVLEEIKVKLNDQFNDCKTLWEVKTKYAELYSGGHWENPLVNLMQNTAFKIEWNGDEIKNSHFNIDLASVMENDDDDDDDDGKINWEYPSTTIYGFNVQGRHSYSKTVNQRRYSRSTNNSSVKIHAKEEKAAVLFYNDIGNGAQARVKHFIDQEGNHNKLVYMIKADDDDIAKIKALLGGAPILDVSTLPKPPKRAKGAPNQGRGIGNGYVWTGGAGYSWRAKPRENWNKQDVELVNGGVYVIMHNFEPLEGEGENEYRTVHELGERINLARKLGLLADGQEVYAFPRGHSKRVIAASNWTNFYEFLEAGVKKLVKDNGYLQNMADSNAWHEFSDNGEHRQISGYIEMLENIDAKVHNSKTSIAAYTEAATTMKVSANDLGDEVRKLAMLMNIDLGTGTPQFDLDSLVTTMKEDYPLLETLLWHMNENLIEHVADYVNMVDEKSVDNSIAA